MLYIKKLKPNLNVQLDSIRAKPFRLTCKFCRCLHRLLFLVFIEPSFYAAFDLIPQKDWAENAVLVGISKQLSRHYKTPLMMSWKEVRNQLLISHDDGVINDEKRLLLYDLSRSDNLDLPYNSYPSVDFDDLED